MGIQFGALFPKSGQSRQTAQPATTVVRSAVAPHFGKKHDSVESFDNFGRDSGTTRRETSNNPNNS